jgi:ribosome-binding protein aMBF1 (putative translation factor)
MDRTVPTTSSFSEASMSDSPQDTLNLQNLGEAVREIREQQGLSTSDVADAADEDETLLAALEAGQLDPEYSTMSALADAMDVRLSTFFVRAEELDSRGAATGR